MHFLTQPDLAKAEASIGRPGLWPLFLRAELWLRARLMPLQLQGRSLRQMLELAEPPTRNSRLAGLSPAYIVRLVRRTTRHLWVMRDRRCLREGLLTDRLLADAGLQPRLHFGVEPGVVTDSRVAAHCWVTLDGRTVIGASQTPYIEILVHPAKDTA